MCGLNNVFVTQHHYHHYHITVIIVITRIIIVITQIIVITHCHNQFTDYLLWMNRLTSKQSRKKRMPSMETSVIQTTDVILASCACVVTLLFGYDTESNQ